MGRMSRWVMTSRDSSEKFNRNLKRPVYFTIVTLALFTIFLTYFTTVHISHVSILPVTHVHGDNAGRAELSSLQFSPGKQPWVVRKVHISQNDIGQTEDSNEISGNDLEVIDEEFGLIGNIRTNISEKILTFHADATETQNTHSEESNRIQYNIPSNPSEKFSKTTDVLNLSEKTPKQIEDYIYESESLLQPEHETETGSESERGTENENEVGSQTESKPVVPVKTNVTTGRPDITYKPEDVNIMAVEPFQYLKEYKNPCWMEDSTRQYESYYMMRTDVRQTLNLVDAILRGRQHQGDYHKVRCLPYFFMIGQPKSGSTDLYKKVIEHPEVASIPPKFKEPHWWARSRLGRHGAKGHIVSLDSYIDVFDYAAYNIEKHDTVSTSGRIEHTMITGEGSMSTFWDNDHWWNMVGNENASEPRLLNPDYIRHLLPQSKLILILRNPSTRMYSDYLYFAKGKKLREDFHEAVVNAAHVYDNCQKRYSLRRCVYNATLNRLAKIRFRIGMYATFLSDWFRVFPRNQFFIVRTEDYAADARGVLRRLYSFLGLRELSIEDEDRIVSLKKANTRRKKDQALGDMLPETRILLDRVYKPHNEQLAKLLGDNRFLWEDAQGIP